MNKNFNIAVVGATGAVGQVMLAILAERQFPIANIYALASEHSVGRLVSCGEQQVPVQNLADFDFSQVQLALFSAGSAISAHYAPLAAQAGCVVIDNSSCFRYEENIPLIVPEVNPQQIVHYKNQYIIANPNCSTIQLLLALKPIYDAVGIERINIATYQSVSGAGQRAIDNLVQQSQHVLAGTTIATQPIAFNVVPQIADFVANGYTQEEMKMVWETQKILGDQTIQVNPTCVRVPVFYGHSEAVHLETSQKISAEQAKAILQQAPGVVVVDEPLESSYPMPLTHAAGTDPVYIGRIRADISHPRGLNMWVVSDNVRKGAALNAVQIAEILVRDYL